MRLYKNSSQILFSIFFILLTLNLNGQLFKKAESTSGDGHIGCKKTFGSFTLSSYVALMNLSFGEGDDCQPITNAPCDLYVGFSVDETGETYYNQLNSCDFYEPFPMEGDTLYEGRVSITFSDPKNDFDCTPGSYLWINYTVNLYCKDSQGNYYPVDNCDPAFHEILPPEYYGDLPCDLSISRRMCFECIGIAETPEEPEKLDSRSHNNSTQENLDVSYNNNLRHIEIKSNNKSDDKIFYSIVNINGQVLMKNNLSFNSQNNLTIPLRNLHTGFYFINVQNGNQITTSKFYFIE